VIKYFNNSGTAVEINDNPANIKAAEKAGWVSESSLIEAKTKVEAKAEFQLTDENDVMDSMIEKIETEAAETLLESQPRKAEKKNTKGK